ncbi:hypothetical protein [Flavobacterium sp.]|uniref:hypothetical protein n=1 Tax=Flavobacterium sp. TaxID=239 RepID=UPI00391B5B1D
MTENNINKLTTSIYSFELFKTESQKYWVNVELECCDGLQIQPGTKWNKGLSENDLKDFQKKLGIEFTPSLKNYFKTMNGLDKLEIDINSYSGDPEFGICMAKYPESINDIKNSVESVFESFEANISNEFVPNIFPYYGNRYLILEQKEIVVSIMNDIVYWSENLCKGLAMDIFEVNHRKLNNKEIIRDNFWNKLVL